MVVKDFQFEVVRLDFQYKVSEIEENIWINIVGNIDCRIIFEFLMFFIVVYSRSIRFFSFFY